MWRKRIALVKVHRGVALIVVVIVVVASIAATGTYGIHAHWTNDDQSVTIQYILACVAVCAGGIATWYTMETRDIRNYSQQQLDLLRVQTQSAHRPYIMSYVYSKESVFRRKEWKSIDYGDPKLNIVEQQLKSVADTWTESRGFYVCVVYNPWDKIALDVITILHVPGGQETFHLPNRSIDVLVPNDGFAIQFNVVATNFWETSMALPNRLRIDRSVLKRYLHTDQCIYTCTFFRSVDGILYHAERTFVESGDNLLNIDSRFTVVTPNHGFRG